MAPTPLAALAPALARLDLVIHREILRMRARYALSLDEQRGLYVSDEQVDDLVTRGLYEQDVDGGIAAVTARVMELRDAPECACPPLARLRDEFALGPFEEDVLLLALAPELDLKYETLFAYLNNDVSRRTPTRDLALRLFADLDGDGHSRSRGALLAEAPLFALGLLRELEPAPDRASSLGGAFVATPATVRFALGLPLASALARVATPVAPETAEHALGEPRLAELHGAARLWSASDDSPVILLEGPRGSGHVSAAAVLCQALAVPLLRVEAGAGRLSAEVLAELALLQRLEPTGVLVELGEAAGPPDGRATAETRAAVERLGRWGGPLLLTGPPGTPWREILGHRACVRLRLLPPDRDERRLLWAACLQERGAAIEGDALAGLADRFALSASQIRRAVAAAYDQHRLVGSDGPPGAAALFRAAREESGHPLEGLAARVETVHGWNDLVLPPRTMRSLREIAAAVHHRHTVYAVWGFDRRIGPGQGLRALFAGGSGTGKTMAAGVIARELELELYKVDLSGVVSKYIGETEKNLDRIFTAARASNAVLFFDEADALFGRRSEVKDAHDRYANLEVAYLLQRVEEHEGIVILATNLRKNIDEAFARRMHYVIEFPLPDDTHREHLWRGMFPAALPLDEAVNFPFLARQFPLTGGEIRNVALDAAFLAARNGGVVKMQHLVQAVARQMLKQGKIPAATDFRQYNTLLDDDG